MNLNRSNSTQAFDISVSRSAAFARIVPARPTALCPSSPLESGNPWKESNIYNVRGIFPVPVLAAIIAADPPLNTPHRTISPGTLCASISRRNSSGARNRPNGSIVCPRGYDLQPHSRRRVMQPIRTMRLRTNQHSGREPA